MNEEFVRGIKSAIRMCLLTKDEGKAAIVNMIHAEQNSKGLDLIPLIKRIEEIEGFLGI